MRQVSNGDHQITIPHKVSWNKKRELPVLTLLCLLTYQTGNCCCMSIVQFCHNTLNNALLAELTMRNSPHIQITLSPSIITNSLLAVALFTSQQPHLWVLWKPFSLWQPWQRNASSFNHEIALVDFSNTSITNANAKEILHQKLISPAKISPLLISCASR